VQPAAAEHTRNIIQLTYINESNLNICLVPLKLLHAPAMSGLAQRTNSSTRLELFAICVHILELEYGVLWYILQYIHIPVMSLFKGMYYESAKASFVHDIGLCCSEQFMDIYTMH